MVNALFVTEPLNQVKCKRSSKPWYPDIFARFSHEYVPKPYYLQKYPGLRNTIRRPRRFFKIAKFEDRREKGGFFGNIEIGGQKIRTIRPRGWEPVIDKFLGQIQVI